MIFKTIRSDGFHRCIANLQTVQKLENIAKNGSSIPAVDFFDDEIERLARIIQSLLQNLRKRPRFKLVFHNRSPLGILVNFGKNLADKISIGIFGVERSADNLVFFAERRVFNLFILQQ